MDLIELIKDQHIIEALDRLVTRELDLLEHPQARDKEIKEIMLWNITALCATIEKLNPEYLESNPVLKDRLETERFEDLPEYPPVPK